MIGDIAGLSSSIRIDARKGMNMTYIFFVLLPKNFAITPSLLGSGPVGDDDLWHHHIGEFSPFSSFSFSFSSFSFSSFPSVPPWGGPGALPAGSEALPAGSKALPAGSKARILYGAAAKMGNTQRNNKDGGGIWR